MKPVKYNNSTSTYATNRQMAVELKLSLFRLKWICKVKKLHSWIWLRWRRTHLNSLTIHLLDENTTTTKICEIMFKDNNLWIPSLSNDVISSKETPRALIYLTRLIKILQFIAFIFKCIVFACKYLRYHLTKRNTNKIHHFLLLLFLCTRFDVVCLKNA